MTVRVAFLSGDLRTVVVNFTPGWFARLLGRRVVERIAIYSAGLWRWERDGSVLELELAAAIIHAQTIASVKRALDARTN